MFPFSIFLQKKLNVCCDPSLEPSRRDGSGELSPHMVLFRNKKIISELFSKLNLTWKSVFIYSGVTHKRDNDLTDRAGPVWLRADG